MAIPLLNEYCVLFATGKSPVNVDSVQVIRVDEVFHTLDEGRPAFVGCDHGAEIR